MDLKKYSIATVARPLYGNCVCFKEIMGICWQKIRNPVRHKELLVPVWSCRQESSMEPPEPTGV